MSQDDEYTVRASDYDAVASALRELMAACRHRLPPGFYDQLSSEIREADFVLTANDQRNKLGIKT